jgi:hypothetical protein
METPRRRRKDRETPNHPVATPAAAPTATSDSPSPVASLARVPTHDEIARRAYQIYEERGGEHGRDWDDWLQAERELRQAAAGRPVAGENSYVAA